MKRNFTKILAAFALLVCVFVPYGMKAAEGDVHDMNITQTTNLNNNAAIPSINIAAQSYSVKTVTINWRYNKTIENPVTIEVLVGGTSWGTQTITGNTTADAVFNGESTIGAIVINFTNNTGSGTGHGTFYVNSVKLTEGAGSGPAPTTYTVTYHANVSGIDDIEEIYNEGATVTIADNTFSNPGYAFTEWNTEADGTGDSYDPGDEIEGIYDDLELYAQWEESDEITDVLTYTLIGVTGTSYTEWNNKTSNSDAVYAGKTAGGNNSIQLNATTSNGIISTTSGGNVRNVTLEWNSNTSSGRKIFVYGSNTPFTSISAMTSTTKLGEIEVGNTSLDIANNYAYVGMVGNGGACYLNKISITWEPNNLIETSVTIDDTNLTNTDVYVSTAAGSLSAVVSADGVAISGATVNWASSNTEVATIASDGVVTLVAAGTTIITATYSGNEQYGSSTDTYELEVTDTTPFTGGDVTFKANVDMGDGSIVKKGVTFSCDNGILNNGSEYRLYKSSTSIFSTENGTITSIAFTGVSGNPVSGFGEMEGLSFNGNNGTWTGNANSVSFVASDAQVRATQIVVTVNLSGTPDPSISADNVEIAYNITSGAIEYTVNNPVDGGELSASTSDNWLTIGTIGNTVPFTCSANEGVAPLTATVTLTYTYNTDQTVTKEVTVTQTVNPALGTVDLPYTVAQARAAIDAGTGVNDVYATGIVSQIVTPFNSEYGNITYNISADGQTNSEQLQAYRGKSYNGDEFTSADDIQVGDIVVIHGNLKKFSGTYEFDSGNQLVSLERPTFDVEAPTFSLAAGTYAEAQSVTISCATTGATIYYTTDGTTPNNESTAYTEALTVSATTTFKAIAYVGEESSMVTTITYHINSASSPYTVAQALAFHEYPTAQAIWVHGIVSTAPTQGPTSDGQLTYYISDNGAASNQLEVYRGKGLNGAEFESQSDIQVGDIVTITGIVKDYNGTIEFDNGNYLVSFERPNYTLTVNGYTEGSTGGYKLIASPVTVYISEVQGLAEGTYDLYTYNDAEEMEWINYKQTDGMHPFTTLEPGTGYLYAKQATTAGETFSFNLTGAPYTGTGEIPVAAGWNLIGNPFAVAATPDMPYYRMNADGSGLNATTESGAVNAMEGVFVNATAAGNVTFSTGTSKGQNIALNVMKGRGTTIDRAIVRFDEGQQLPKFQLFENSTKLYIPQGNKDFAIVRSAAEGEMPVNFRASENGTYTLSIETENVEMNYLHLIDNMTGADVDLLATPNYTFEARTNDYTSRFRLVFSAEENGASTGSATFAYFNGTSWTVSNTGDATLQVVDITGRIVSSETINGNATVSLNQPAGIYMLRLVNGNDVKVQKVVVR